MALVATQKMVVGSGLRPTHGAAAVGDTFDVRDNTFLSVINGGSTMTVTIPKAIDQYNAPGFGDIPLDDIVVSVTVSTTPILIPIPRGSHSNGGRGIMNFSSVTSVTVAVVEFPNI